MALPANQSLRASCGKRRFVRLLAFAGAAIGLVPVLHAAGASTPFTTVEAETGRLAGGATLRAFKLGSPVPDRATLELEASGGSLVQLDRTGASVAWSNPVASANTIVIRSSIPDAPQGGGITATLNLYVDGEFRQAITLSSRQSWIYRGSRTGLDDPHGGGMPYHFYNEDRAFITGKPIPAGSIITLQKDEPSSAAVYDIDCIDLEAVAPPLPRPADSLSIVDYGADKSGATDSQAAIEKCISDARKGSKTVWIPPGRYIISSQTPKGLDLTGVKVCGAGRWYSMLYRNVPRPLPSPLTDWRSYFKVGTGTTLADVSIDSSATIRGKRSEGGGDYGILASGENWVIERIWVQHCDAQWLSGSNGIIRDSRVADSWADGINLNNGNKPSPSSLGVNLTAENNFVRGTGDDCIATYSDRGPSGKNSQMVGTRILNNTCVAPWWANSLRVAGGRDVVVRGNLVTDSSSNNTMDVSVFGDTGQPLESALIENNVILRGGGWNGTHRHNLAIGSRPDIASNVIIRNNVIRDSRRAGVFIGATLEHVTMENNQLVYPATCAILVGPGVMGTGIFKNNTISGLNPGQVLLDNESPRTFTTKVLR